MFSRYIFQDLTILFFLVVHDVPNNSNGLDFVTRDPPIRFFGGAHMYGRSDSFFPNSAECKDLGCHLEGTGE